MAPDAVDSCLPLAATRTCAERLPPLLAYFDRVVFTRFSNNPRGADPNDLLELGQELSGKTAQVISDPKEAWQTVLAAAGPDDLLAVVGSFYLVGELGLENSLK